jgi:hypothetical protein
MTSQTPYLEKQGSTKYSDALAEQNCQVNTRHQLWSTNQMYKSHSWNNMATKDSGVQYNWHLDEENAKWGCTGTKSHSFRTHAFGWNQMGNGSQYAKDLYSAPDTLPCNG